MQKYDFIELIRRYFKRELSEQELDDFHQLSSSNEEFTEKLTEFTLFHELFEMRSLYEKSHELLANPAIRSSRETYSPVIKVAIVDDHLLFRKGLVKTVNMLSGYRVVWEANNGRECIEKISSLTQPDILLLDTLMPEMDGYETVVWLNKHFPLIKILAITNEYNTLLKRILANGASGYIFRYATSETIHTAFTELIAERPLNTNKPLPGQGNKFELVFAKYKTDLYRKTEEIHKLELSKREMEVLKLVSCGFSTSEIADKLSVAPTTITTHQKNMMKKVHVKNVSELVRYALNTGLIDPPTR